MKIVMTITGAVVPDDAVAAVGRELIAVVRQHATSAIAEETGRRSHVHVEAWAVSQPHAPQEAPPCPEPTSSPRPDPSPAPDAPTPATSSASLPPSPGAPSAPTPGTTPPTTGAPTSGGPTPAEDDSSTPSAAATDEPSPASDGPPWGPWDDTSGQDDTATVHRLITEGGPGLATGADLREAALYMHDRSAATGAIASHLGVPLGVVRGWLREETARA